MKITTSVNIDNGFAIATATNVETGKISTHSESIIGFFGDEIRVIASNLALTRAINDVK